MKTIVRDDYRTDGSGKHTRRNDAARIVYHRGVVLYRNGGTLRIDKHLARSIVASWRETTGIVIVL